MTRTFPVLANSCKTSEMQDSPSLSPGSLPSRDPKLKMRYCPYSVTPVAYPLARLVHLKCLSQVEKGRRATVFGHISLGCRRLRTHAILATSSNPIRILVHSTSQFFSVYVCICLASLERCLPTQPDDRLIPPSSMTRAMIHVRLGPVLGFGASSILLSDVSVTLRLFRVLAVFLRASFLELRPWTLYTVVYTSCPTFRAPDSQLCPCPSLLLLSFRPVSSS
jgi:hypothetical protein